MSGTTYEAVCSIASKQYGRVRGTSEVLTASQHGSRRRCTNAWAFLLRCKCIEDANCVKQFASEVPTGPRNATSSTALAYADGIIP
jgi:hypothetical protein